MANRFLVAGGDGNWNSRQRLLNVNPCMSVADGTHVCWGDLEVMGQTCEPFACGEPRSDDLDVILSQFGTAVTATPGKLFGTATRVVPIACGDTAMKFRIGRVFETGSPSEVADAVVGSGPVEVATLHIGWAGTDEGEEDELVNGKAGYDAFFTEAYEEVAMRGSGFQDPASTATFSTSVAAYPSLVGDAVPSLVAGNWQPLFDRLFGSHDAILCKQVASGRGGEVLQHHSAPLIIGIAAGVAMRKVVPLG